MYGVRTWHRRRSRRWIAASGPGWVPTHLDGCQGGRLGGHTPAWQSGGNQRALVQRAEAAGIVAAGVGTSARSGSNRRSRAAQVYESFNKRFWYAQGGYLYDVVDSEHTAADDCCRPNQVFAISLKYPVLDPQRWESVLHVVKEKLLTPVGLRSLAPGSKEYRSKYDGDLRSRDAAYHQGTVWAWLIGPFVDAWLKLYPEDIGTARHFLSGFEAHLSEACIGTISEIFDAEPPYAPRGCAAQAWSVAEVLCSFVKTAATTEPEGARNEENVQLAHS